jgi:predicted lipoprotein with Yx(FWY)xxD motif
MKRPKLFAGIIVLAAASLTTAAIAMAATSATKITLHRTSLGKLISNSHGFTLYEFTHDKPGRDSCVKIKFCASTWPPVTTKGKPVAGVGVKASLLGTIKLPNGKRQVTYNHHALYRYSGDFEPGQTDYVGVSMFGGKWNGLNAAGKAVK